MKPGTFAPEPFARLACNSSAAILSIFFTAGCVNELDRNESQPDQGPATFSCPVSAYENIEINFRDGVDSYEARLLAKVYFSRFYGNCGMLGDVEDHKNEWSFPCYVGIAPLDKPAILVSKVGCRLSCLRGPTIINPTTLTNWDRSFWRNRSDQSAEMVQPTYSNEN